MARQKLTINQIKDLQTSLDGKALSTHNHVVADVTDFTTASQTLIDSSITSLKAEVDPFPQYLTDAEGDAQYSQLGHSHTLDEISDVILTTPSNGQVLKFNGTNWVNETDSSVSAFSNLTDVNLSSLANGQLVKYNSTSGKWENFTPDYAATSHTHTSSQITDFDTTAQALIDSSITALKAEADPFPQYLTDAEGDAQYSQLGHNHAISDVTGLQTALDGKASTTHTHTLDELSDVILTTPSNGQVLKFDGTNWINGEGSTVAALVDLTDVNLTSLANGQLIKYNSTSGKWENFTPDYAATSHNHTVSNITDFTTASQTLIDSSITALKAEADPFTQYLTTTEANGIYSQLGHTHTASEITDFTTASQTVGNALITALKAEADPFPQYLTPAEADLVYAPIGTTVNNLNDLGDVTITTPSAGHVLKYNGSAWVNGVESNGSGIQGFAVQDAFIATEGQTVFTLANTATGVSIVTVNGVQQKPTSDYSISGATLTFTYGLTVADEVMVTYGINLASSIGIEDQIIDGVINKAPSQNAVYDALMLKQDTLVSGTNIKTVNGSSILGSGDISVSTSKDLDFEDVMLFKAIPTTWSNGYISEGSASSLLGGFTGKQSVTYLTGNLNGIADTPYGRVGGSLLGTGANTTGTNALSTARAIMTGNGGYKFVFFGGFDQITPSLTGSFFGVREYSSSGWSGTSTSFDTPGMGLAGFGHRPTDTNVQLIRRPSGAGALTQYIDLGANFPVESYTHYKITVYRFNSIEDSINRIYVSIVNLITGASYSDVLVSGIPALSDLLTPYVKIVVTTSSIGAISFVKMVCLNKYGSSLA